MKELWAGGQAKFHRTPALDPADHITFLTFLTPNIQISNIPSESRNFKLRVELKPDDVTNIGEIEQIESAGAATYFRTSVTRPLGIFLLSPFRHRQAIGLDTGEHPSCHPLLARLYGTVMPDPGAAESAGYRPWPDQTDQRRRTEGG